jgi:hypothetical protein
MSLEYYTATGVQFCVLIDIERLFAPWLVGRSPNYNADTATKNTIALGYWLEEELTRIGANDADRRTCVWKYNRLGRTYDIWDTGAAVLNDFIDGNVEQNRRGHRRWG